MEVQQLLSPLVAAVPLHHVIVEEEVRPSHGYDKHQLANGIEMLAADEVIHVFHGSTDDSQHNHSRTHTGVQSTHDEVWTEDGG